MMNLRDEKVTVDHVKLVMQVMGKLHALSFALKDQQPEKFESIVSKLDEVFFSPNNTGMAIYINSLPKTLFNAISDGKDAYLLKRVVQLYERNQFDMGAECVNSTLAEPYAVICHGLYSPIYSVNF